MKRQAPPAPPVAELLAQLPPHPLVPSGRRFQRMGVVVLCLGAMMAALGPAAMVSTIFMAATAVATGLMFIWLGTTTLRQARAVQIYNFAYDHAARGESARAEELLSAIATRARRDLGAAIALQRAGLAVHRGDATAAEQLATAALGARSSLLASHKQTTATAYGMRAFARAMRQDEAGVRADVDVVRATRFPHPRGLALATLAMCIVHATRKDTGALTRELDGFPRMLESLNPRERGLARALRRMVSPRRLSVYRETAAIEAPSEATLESWVGAIVPEAAEFVARTPHKDRASLRPVPNEDSPTAVPPRADPWKRAARKRRILALLIAAILASLGFGLVAALGDERRPVTFEGSSIFASVSFVFFGVVLLFVGLVARSIVLGRRYTDRLTEADQLFAAGRDVEARAVLDALKRTAYVSAARLADAVRRERDGDLVGALEECDLALAHLSSSPQRRAGAADLVLPGLVAERAFVLAALGKSQECTAALAQLAMEHRGYAFMGRARLRAEVMRAVHDGELTRAAELAGERTPELPLPLFDDVLCDAVLALAPTGTAAAAAQLVAEIDASSEMRRWFDVVAPTVLRELHDRANVTTAVSAREPVRVAREQAVDEADLVDERSAEQNAGQSRRDAK